MIYTPLNNYFKIKTLNGSGRTSAKILWERIQVLTAELSSSDFDPNLQIIEAANVSESDIGAVIVH